MITDQKPLYALNIGEFIALTKRLIAEALKEKEESVAITEQEKGDDVCTIYELMKFLHCSKASIHNYKKLGMPFYRVGRKILFKKLEVLNFMKTLKGRYNLKRQA